MHPILDNRTGLAAQPLFLLDQEARPVCTVVVKGSFRIGPGGICTLDEKQAPIALEPIHYGDPETTSLKLDTEAYHFKPTTDVVVLGHARTLHDMRELMVVIAVGSVRIGMAVVGERVWVSSMGSVVATQPLPFTEMPLVYERAYGGWDRAHPDPQKHAVEPRNPVGVGFRLFGGYEEGLRLPNLEHPHDRLSSFGQRVVPIGCGYVGPHWQPRAALAGTYDEAWQKSRAPRYPKDFDPRHLNGASPALVAPTYLRGDEAFTLTNVGPAGRGLNGALPGLAPPPVRIRRIGGRAPEELAMKLDTVLFFCDEEKIQLIWRGRTVLQRGPHDVAAIEIGMVPEPVVVDGADEEPEDEKEEAEAWASP